MKDEKDITEPYEEEEERGDVEETSVSVDDTVNEMPEEESSEEKKSSESEKKYTKADLDRAVNKALARKLPPKEEMNAFREWKKSQQSEAEKQAEREKRYAEIDRKVEMLEHENAVIKAGVSAEDVDYVIFKVEKMEGEYFEDNLSEFLKDNPRLTKPKTIEVKNEKHEPTKKKAMTREDLKKMKYSDRVQFKKDHPQAYAEAMGR